MANPSAVIVHEITIKYNKTRVYVVPGKPKIRAGEFVVFVNETPGRLKIQMAAGTILKGAGKLVQQHVKANGVSKPYEVENNPGTHEYSVHFEFKDPGTDEKRAGFAEAYSSPVIVIIKPATTK